ncbi:MAG: hypothetical protein K0Q55_423 [Verrucomicrobia bacterium]|jgi:hypothetical protein|nr:hypothetical protein [Verrucomicrobiota bacterium]
METGSLLAASKTVRRASDEPSPFRVDEKKRLPRFDKTVRPAADETLFPDAPGGGTDAAPESSGSGPHISSATVAPGKTLRETLFGQRVKARAEKAAAQFGALQQAELKLDQVKVIRNDLSETDFELAAPKQPGIVNSAAKVAPQSKGGAAWSWLTAKLFSLGRRWK